MISRRKFLKVASLLSSAIAFANQRTLFARGETSSTKKFIHLHIDGGADPFYGFDGCELSLIRSKQQHIYGNIEHFEWKFANNVALVSTAFSSLRNFVNDLIVFRGVHTGQADGHLPNLNLLLCGQPEGGEDFLPFLNRFNTPLDAIHIGHEFESTLLNGGRTVRLNIDDIVNLKQLLFLTRPIDMENETFQFVHQRFQNLLNIGLKFPERGFEDAKFLASQLSTIDSDENNDEQRTLTFIRDLVQKNVVSSVRWVIGRLEDFDCHSPDLARFHPIQMEKIAEKLSRIISVSKNLELYPGRSLFDESIFLVTSEFGRTLRQHSIPVERTGTDHNEMNGMVLLFGGGLQGGRLIGSSDFKKADEKLSQAHTSRDPFQLKSMGHVFDYNNQRSIPEAKPIQFRLADYLTIHSIINSIFSEYSVDRSLWRQVVPGTIAPLINL